MWLGRDTIDLKKLLEFVNENALPGTSLAVSAPIGQLISPESGTISFKKPSFLRRFGAPMLIFDCEKKRSWTYTVGEFAQDIERFLASTDDPEVVVKASIGGKYHQLQGDIKIYVRGSSESTFFLSPSSVMTQVFEKPTTWMPPTTDEEEPDEGRAASDFKMNVGLPISNVDSYGLDAWSGRWSEDWPEIDDCEPGEFELEGAPEFELDREPEDDEDLEPEEEPVAGEELEEEPEAKPDPEPEEAKDESEGEVEPDDDKPKAEAESDAELNEEPAPEPEEADEDELHALHGRHAAKPAAEE